MTAVASAMTDDVVVRSSTRFEAIHDPHDPAWHGHARDDVLGRWPSTGAPSWKALVAAIVVATLVVVFVATQRGNSSSAPSTAARSAPSASSAPQVRAASMPAPRAPTVPAIIADPKVEIQPTAPREQKQEPVSSGWAPEAATVAPQDRGSGRLDGDLAGVAPALIAQLDALAVAIDRDVQVVSGWRTRHEQTSLYQRYLGGTGNLAAVPGTSNHESGGAADVYVDGTALALIPGATEQARSLGLHFPVPGEPWHVEMVQPATV